MPDRAARPRVVGSGTGAGPKLETVPTEPLMIELVTWTKFVALV